MTTKEKELKMIEALGLKVGDKIKMEFSFYEIKDVAKIDGICLENISTGFLRPLSSLINNFWVKVKPSQKDKKCKDFTSCQDCPLGKYNIHCGSQENTLEEILKIAGKEWKEARQEVFGEE